MRKLFLAILILLSLTIPLYSQVKPPLGKPIRWDNPLMKGLAGFWLMNEGSGGKIYDLSGNGNHATATGTTTEISWKPGNDGYCIDFVGDNIAYFALTNTITFASTDKWTVVMKLQMDGDVSEAVVIGQYNTTNDYIFLPEGSGYTRFRSSSGANIDFTHDTHTNWETLAFVSHGADSVDMYLNGIYYGNDTGVAGFVIDSFGNGYNSASYEMDGRFSYIIIYERALTSSEIRQLYANPFAMFMPSFDLMLFGALSAGGGEQSSSLVTYGGAKSAGKSSGKNAGKQD